jgi:hypothetical protein
MPNCALPLAAASCTVTVGPPLPAATWTSVMSPPVAVWVDGAPVYWTPLIVKVKTRPPWLKVPGEGASDPVRLELENSRMADDPEISITTFEATSVGGVVEVVVVVAGAEVVVASGGGFPWATVVEVVVAR